MTCKFTLRTHNDDPVLINLIQNGDIDITIQEDNSLHIKVRDYIHGSQCWTIGLPEPEQDNEEPADTDKDDEYIMLSDNAMALIESYKKTINIDGDCVYKDDLRQEFFSHPRNRACIPNSRYKRLNRAIEELARHEAVELAGTTLRDETIKINPDFL